MLVVLVEKGHVSRRLVGKAFFYEARVPKATMLQSMTDGLARVFAGGSHPELVVQLMETSDITPADLELILQTAAGLSPEKGRRKAK